MLKVIFVILLVTLISYYIHLSICYWQFTTEDMEEIPDNGPIFYPEYICINPFEVIRREENV